MLKLKVLIIDDEEDYCGIMKNYFSRRAYSVTVCHTLREGLSQLAESKPDIVLLDNNLPDGKGWNHVESILENHPGVRLYLVSAYYKKEDSFVTADDSRMTIWEKPLSMALLNEHF